MCSTKVPFSPLRDLTAIVAHQEKNCSFFFVTFQDSLSKRICCNKARSIHQGDGIICVGLFPLVIFTTMANLRTTTVNQSISQWVVGFETKYAISSKNFNGTLFNYNYRRSVKLQAIMQMHVKQLGSYSFNLERNFTKCVVTQMFSVYTFSTYLVNLESAHSV